MGLVPDLVFRPARRVAAIIVNMMDKLVTGAARLGITLGERELTQFETFYRELVDWNQRMNLTSITGYEAAQVNHFLDALTVALVWKPGATARVMDVGAGAGVPGIPLKIVFPQLELTLLEATAKKTVFLKHVVRTLGLESVEVVAGRAEEAARLPQHRDKYDLVLARGLAKLATLAELTLPFCRKGGLVIAHKRGDMEQEVAQAQTAISVLGGKLRELHPVDLPEFPDNRVLVVIDKVSPTPEKYPRRTGVPAQSPL